MDHQLIEDTSLPERYLTGRLDGRERALFEEHLVDCQFCLERIEASEALATGLRALAAPVGRVASAPVLARRRAHRSTWLVLGACAASVLAVVVTNARRGQLARELASERTVSVEARGQLNAAREQLSVEHTAREAAEARLSAQPQRTAVRIPVLALIATRGASTAALELPAAPGPFLLLAERENPPHFQSYGVTLRSSAGAVLWQGHVRPSSRDVVAVALDSGRFAPGSYSLVLEGEGLGGRLSRVAQYSFRTVAAPSQGASPENDGPR
jgi:hypothetical protein